MAEGKVDLWEINPLRTVDGECMICSGEGHGYGLIATVLDENDAKRIVTAVNTYPAVEGLVKALEGLVQAYKAPAGKTYSILLSRRIDAAEIALLRFRSLQNGSMS